MAADEEVDLEELSAVTKRLLVICGCAITALVAAPAAYAAFPGVNGKIAFVRLDGNFDQIFTINSDGTGESELTSSSNSVNSETPNWSPDGQKIVFCRGQCFSGDPNSEIWVMNADGTDQHKVPNTGTTDFQPAFIDNSRIVFVRIPNVGGAQIWVINADGSGATQLTTPPSGMFDQDPTSSPNGQTIAFSRGDFGDQVIFTVPSAGGTPTERTNDHGMTNIWDDEPNYSPDGGTIAFQRCPTIERCSSPANLFTVPAGGGTTTQITNGTSSDPSNCQPAYAPDGSRIVFAQFPNDRNCEQVSLASPPAGGLAFVAPGGGAVQSFVNGFEPDWQPKAAAASCPKINADASSYRPPRVVTPTVPGVRAWIYVSQPSQVKVHAILHWGRGHTRDLGEFFLHDLGRKKLRIPIPGDLKNELPIGRKVTLELVINATPDAAPQCTTGAAVSKVLHTRVVHILRNRP